MIFAALLLAIVITIGVLVTRRSPGSTRLRVRPPNGTTSPTAEVPGVAEALLTRWGNAGLLSMDKVEEIRRFERSAATGTVPSSSGTRVHAIAEALGYLGGVLGLTGVVVLIARFWDEFGEIVRLGIPAGATAVFVIAGVLVPERRGPSFVRLRTFLWTLAVVSVAVAAWVFVDVVLDVEDVRRHWMAVGLSSGMLSGFLWQGRERPIPQITTIAGTAIALGTLVGEFASAGFSGLALWVAGAALLSLSLRSTSMRARVGVLSGSILIVVGASLTATDWKGPGLVFVLMTGIGLLVPAGVTRVKVQSPVPLIMGVIGAIALVQDVPMTIAHFSNEAGIATGLVLWGSGIATTVLVARRMLRLDLVFLLAAGAMIIGGCAVMGRQSAGFATVFGLATSVGLIAFGTRPGRALLSVFGLIGIVVFIPWTISHYFPGEGRVPLLIIVSGLLLVAAAVTLIRIGDRLRGEVRMHSNS